MLSSNNRGQDVILIICPGTGSEMLKPATWRPRPPEISRLVRRSAGSDLGKLDSRLIYIQIQLDLLHGYIHLVHLVHLLCCGNRPTLLLFVPILGSVDFVASQPSLPFRLGCLSL